MTDAEIGELWRETELFGSDYNENGAPMRSAHLKGKLRDTIRKLVEERALVLEMRGWRKSETTRMALRDYGIPEENWE